MLVGERVLVLWADDEKYRAIVTRQRHPYVYVRWSSPCWRQLGAEEERVHRKNVERLFGDDGASFHDKESDDDGDNDGDDDGDEEGDESDDESDDESEEESEDVNEDSEERMEPSARASGKRLKTKLFGTPSTHGGTVHANKALGRAFNTGVCANDDEEEAVEAALRATADPLPVGPGEWQSETTGETLPKRPSQSRARSATRKRRRTDEFGARIEELGALIIDFGRGPTSRKRYYKDHPATFKRVFEQDVRDGHFITYAQRVARGETRARDEYVLKAMQYVEYFSSRRGR